MACIYSNRFKKYLQSWYSLWWKHPVESCSHIDSGNTNPFLPLLMLRWIRFIWLFPAYLFLLVFSHSAMSDSLWPRGLQHNSFLCPSPSPGTCSNSCPLNQWCHPTISSSFVPFFSCLQSFSASESFLTTWLFALGGQSNEAWVSAKVLPMGIQD